MTEFGLDESLLRKIVSVIAKRLSVERAVIYGSRARGNFKNYSDIDIAISAPSMPGAEFSQLAFDIDSLPIIFKMDIVHLEPLKNAPLKEKILRDGKTIFERSESPLPVGSPVG